MPEKGYLELRKEDIDAERERRMETDAIRTICVELIKRFGFINYGEDTIELDDGSFQLPAAEWSEDGRELFELQLKDEQLEEILESEMEMVPKDLRFSRVAQIDIVYYPRELEETTNDRPITVAYIRPWDDMDGEAIIYGFHGEVLSLEDTRALHNDIKRYQDLLEQGKTERIPNWRPV